MKGTETKMSKDMPEEKVDGSDWREIVQQKISKRHQTLATQKKASKRIIEKSASPLPFRLPKIPKDVIASPTYRKSATLYPFEPTSSNPNIDAGNAVVAQIEYNIPPPDPEELYKPVQHKLEKLPLEFFDVDEGDRSPQEWMALNELKYDGKGIPAQAMWFDHHEWEWNTCLVHKYDEFTQLFTISFGPLYYEKQVQRLSLLFDEEDPQRFQLRLANCTKWREHYLSIRRYTNLIDSQPSTLFYPVRSSVLQSILSKVMIAKNEHLVQQQHAVDQLVSEIRNEYVFSMKTAFIQQKRLDPTEEEKMKHLRLPSVAHDQPSINLPQCEPKLQPSSKISVERICSALANAHYYRHSNCAQIILALIKALEASADDCFYDLNIQLLKLPTALGKFIDHQDLYIKSMTEKISAEWRSFVANLIRSNLSNVFKLFVNEWKEYGDGPLHKFLRVVTYILQSHLVNMIERSVSKLMAWFSRYAQPLSSFYCFDISNIDPSLREATIEHALSLFNSQQWSSLLSRADGAPQPPPLFTFELVERDGKMVYSPLLDQLKPSLLSLLELPKKLSGLTTMQHEVVPLLEVEDVPLINKDSCGYLWNNLHSATTNFAGIIEQNLKFPLAFQQRFGPFAKVLEINVDDYVKEWFSPSLPASNETNTSDEGVSSVKSEPTLDATKQKIGKYFQCIDNLNNLLPRFVSFSFIRIDCDPLRQSLIEKCLKISDGLLNGLLLSTNSDIQSIIDNYEHICSTLAAQARDVYEMAEQRTFCENVELCDIPEMRKQLSIVSQKLDILFGFQMKIPDEDIKRAWNAMMYPQRLETLLSATITQIAVNSTQFHSDLEKEQREFASNLEAYSQLADTFVEFEWGDVSQMEANAAQVESLAEKVELAQKAVDTFQRREKLFGEVPMEYSELTALRTKFSPHFELWSTSSQYHSSYSVWMTGPFLELDAEQIGKDVSSWYKNLYKLEKYFGSEDQQKPEKVATELKSRIGEFKLYLPLIVALRNPGLQTRHWDKISALLFPPPKTTQLELDSVTLSSLLGLNIMNYRQEIEEISESASKEYAIEMNLDKMAKEWKSITFTLEAFKTTNVYTLKGADDIMTMIDDQLLKVQSMRGSPFIKVFEGRAKKWEGKLQLMSSLLEEWCSCQKVWMYFQPIFHSEDIMKQMPVEGRRFLSVESFLRKTSESAKKVSIVIEFLGENEGLLKTFQESNRILDMIGKHLNEYLETKRLAFPRFFFLSNEELLSILSQTKNVFAIQQHLTTCFDAMQSLTFRGESHQENLQIFGMESLEGEKVPFIQPIYPNEGAKKGNVELWLKDVETGMRETLKSYAVEGIKSYVQQKREDWIRQHCGQVILAVSQLFWTREVTNVLQSPDAVVQMVKLLGKLNKQLEGLVELVRGNLTDDQRLTIGALIVLDVHARDIVQHLINQKVSEESHFDWMSQMRYYCEQVQTNAMSASTLPILRVRMLTSTVDYGYEYLGNPSRLVITPLTDRCYRTIMSAIPLNYGSAPSGPAGTGKTETVKDLAKALGQMCVVFNCSEALNFKSMGKFFKGLAASGAWACLDEFNRMELEVLSVIAQQIASIQRAMAEKKTTFNFEGVNIPLVATCGVFVTMNPGYQGRAELPENLKVLFRTVAMMIPDYALIAEIVLYSAGYQNARNLARKIVNCLKLASEQLSSQEHYDFGMRNVKSILTAAGKLRFDRPTEAEEILCVQALFDCNLPKFVSNDIPLFMGIVKDLFPTVEMKPEPRDALVNAVKAALHSEGLEGPSTVIGKINELYDTLTVRHGIMLVGGTMSGKSTNIRILAKALTSMAQNGTGNAKEFLNGIEIRAMNPKSVTLGQLYGAESSTTGEWMDGILPVVMRAAVQSAIEKQYAQWILFDGPVDALWIENCNTCLDDNKKLCIASGEIIKFSNGMKMLFEVENLTHASPATVSRCGMVFMEPKSLGWKVIIESWLHSLPETFQSHMEEIERLSCWLLPPILEFMNKYGHPVIETNEVCYANSFVRLMNASLNDNKELLEKSIAKQNTNLNNNPDNTFSSTTTLTVIEDSDNFSYHACQWIECTFIFSLLHSIGSYCSVADRTLFSEFFAQLLSGQIQASSQHSLLTPKAKSKFSNISISAEYSNAITGYPFPSPLPEGATLFDYQYSITSRSWVYWMHTIPPYSIPRNVLFHQIIVPTVDIIRTNALMNILVPAKKHILLFGPTGTGKSVCVRTKLLKELDLTKYFPLLMSFSAQSTAYATQDLIESKLERRRVGVLGPPPNKSMVIFIDDLHVPAREFYGAQPPIELLRQWMDYGGLYDTKTQQFRDIIDVQFIGAMSNNRNMTTARFLRHFQLISMQPHREDSLKHIYGTILDWWMGNLHADLQPYSRELLEATIHTYTTISAELLPTPSKSHYTFNLRDLSKIFAGIINVDLVSIKSLEDITKVWAHECTRVLYDRLCDSDDRSWFLQLLSAHIKDTFQIEVSNVYPNHEGNDYRQIFCDFAKNHNGSYRQVEDLQALGSTIEGFLEDYNNMEKNGMNLCLFSSAIDHVARINRIIRTPHGNGHALLVGMGGSGRQSLTKLCTFMCEMELFTIEMTKDYGLGEWREDLKTLMRNAGLQDKKVVFLLTDSQIKSDAIMEDVNHLLNNGEVPNMFPPDELTIIIEKILPDARKENRAENNASIYQYFVERCRNNVHIVLCLSPVGERFRSWLRDFPSLVNCTTIDWVDAWPNSALQQVAERYLGDVQIDEKLRTNLVEVCVQMQNHVLGLSKEFHHSLRRYNYVTATSYLEFIKLFRTLYESTYTKIAEQLKKYETGLKKLIETEVQVKAMQAQLETLKPELLQSSKETAELMENIEKRTLQVNQTRALVRAEEKECNAQADAANAIKVECEENLKEAMPALQSAVAALAVLKKAALDELKAMKVPTPAVILTIEALCILMGVPPKKVGQVGSKVDDYWEPAKKKLLNDPQLFAKLQNFDKDNIPAEIIAKVRPYCRNPDFSPAKVEKASKAAEGFCRWVLAMEIYDRVAKQIAPKREALAAAEAKLRVASELLASKKAQLEEVEALLNDLNSQFELVNQKKISLENQVNECSNRLERAEKLLGGLSSEKIRWGERVQNLTLDLQNVIGNVLLGSGTIAYLGVFTSTYRSTCVQNWMTLLHENEIPYDSSFSLNYVLGDPVQIRQWATQSLPKDTFSTDNAVILTRSLRYGLLIDPQLQANKWIKKMEESQESNMRVIRHNDENLLKITQQCVQYGTPLLVENVEENIDPLFDPILLHQTFKQSGQTMIKLGDDIVHFHSGFRVYFTTKLQNPHYSPETNAKVTLINFMITPEGLEDQMLNTVVSAEEPQLEAERSELIIKNVENSRQLALIEDKILQKLNESKGMILDDEELIATLQKSKKASKLIEKRVLAAQKTEETINRTRMAYSGVAFFTSNLFFCVSDLSMVDSMYQFSLQWFIALFLRAVKEADKSLEISVRSANIEKQFMKIFYVNVCRSLFEKDKLLFSFMLAVRILMGKGLVDASELRFLLTGGPSMLESDIHNPTCQNPPEDEEEDDEEEEDEEDELECPAGEDDSEEKPSKGTEPSGTHTSDQQPWLDDRQWNALVHLSKLSAFEGISNHVAANQHKWRRYIESNEPISNIMPGKWDNLSYFHKLCVLRCVRNDRLISSISSFVAHTIGKEFIAPPAFDLPQAYLDSDPCTPLIFILSPGVDPVKEVYKVAANLGFQPNEKICGISLGQGQGTIAESAIREGIDKGSWIVLQNCHVLVSWLPTLQKIIEEIQPHTTNADFRLFLTSMPTPSFPVSLLQSSVKITTEPPKGIQANMAGLYRMIEDPWLEESKKPEDLKRLTFGLSFFHAIIQERRKYGAMGWNILYDFTESDFQISRTQIKTLLETYDAPPYQAIQYLIGELNYGGRVTDDWDRRTLNTILKGYLNHSIMSPEVQFDKQGLYVMPGFGSDASEYRASISEMPSFDESDVFGLHSNVNISCAVKESNGILSTILSLQPRVGGDAANSRDAEVAAIAHDIEKDLPMLYDIDAIISQYPITYDESMNTVLVQECIRFNRLLSTIKRTIADLQRALLGQIVMSKELDEMAQSLYDGSVPTAWSKIAYPSMKPLGSWLNDFRARLRMFATWISSGASKVFWISGFFFTQSFLTATMQNFARKHKIAIDECTFEFTVMPNISASDPAVTPPESGVYVHGLFLEGARWDIETNHLAEAYRRQLYSELPVLHICPLPVAKLRKDIPQYNCPVYKTSQRAGTLSTTGHSTNFVITVRLNSHISEDHWIKRGVALLTQLDI